MTPDALSGFHASVAAWFRSRFPAPTGSGKTLTAFLSAINDLVVEGLAHGLSNEVHVLYVSPLKAHSNDIQKNLQEPLAGIRDHRPQSHAPYAASD